MQFADLGGLGVEYIGRVSAIWQRSELTVDSHAGPSQTNGSELASQSAACNLKRTMSFASSACLLR